MQGLYMTLSHELTKCISIYCLLSSNLEEACCSARIRECYICLRNVNVMWKQLVLILFRSSVFSQINKRRQFTFLDSCYASVYSLILLYC